MKGKEGSNRPHRTSTPSRQGSDVSVPAVDNLACNTQLAKDSAAKQEVYNHRPVILTLDLDKVKRGKFWKDSTSTKYLDATSDGSRITSKHRTATATVKGT